MGGCATKPKALESEEAPAPVEAPTPVDAPAATEKADTVPQENENGGETKKEEPLVDVSEPTTEAPKTEEATSSTEAKPVTEEAVPAADSKPKEVAEAAEEVKA